jgi:carbon-monoxide dehydrogenase medium subunit
VEEAVELLRTGNGKVLAGGTDLVIALGRGEVRPEFLVEVTRIPDLRGVGVDDRRVRVGAAVTFSELVADEFIGGRVPALAQAAAQVGSPQIRNAGTVGGNIANGSPAADVVVPLVALDARVTLASARGVREVPLEELLEAGPGEVKLAPDELITHISFPTPGPASRGSFVKLGRRNALAIARLSMAVVASVAPTGVIEQVAIALGAVGPHPFRAREVEEMMVGQRYTEELRRAVIEALSSEVGRSLGTRPSAPYKREAVKGVAWEALERCLGAPSGNGRLQG